VVPVVGCGGDSYLELVPEKYPANLVENRRPFAVDEQAVGNAIKLAAWYGLRQAGDDRADHS